MTQSRDHAGHGRGAGPFRAMLRVAQVELLSSARDRMTMVYAVLLPLALYPTIFFVLLQVWLLVQGREQHTAVQVGVMAPAECVEKLGSAGFQPEGVLDALVRRPGDAQAAAEASRIEAVELRDARAGDEAAARAWIAAPDGPDAVLVFGRCEAGAGAAAEPLLVHDTTSPRGKLAAERLRPRLEEQAETLRLAAARQAGLTSGALEALEAGPRRDLAPAESRVAFLMSFLLPMLLVFMTLSGAFYPAIDATAGERERGTHDTTLLLPVPRSTVLHGKILAVAALAMTATLLNVLALGLSAGQLLSMLKGASSQLQYEIPWTAFAAIVPLALLFAFFVAAVLMAFASRAKTFKEGQAALGPLQIVFYLPALAGAMPGLALTPQLACVPVLNVVLAFRDLLKGRWAPLEYGLAACSLLACALAAVWGATWFLQREQRGGAAKAKDAG